MSDNDLARLIEMSRSVRTSKTEREQQRRSFAYGNTNFENKRITRDTVNRAAEQLTKSPLTAQ